MTRFPAIAAVVVTAVVVGGVALSQESRSSEGGGVSANDDSAPVESFEAIEFESCVNTGEPGGFDLKVHGIACDDGASLLVDLSNPFESYDSNQSLVYQSESQGDWRCFARFEVDSGPIEHVCWSGNAVMQFKSQ